MVGVELPRRNKAIKGTRPSILAARPHRGWAWARAHTASARPQLPWGRPWQVHWRLKGAVEHELNLDAVVALLVIGPFQRQSASGLLMASKNTAKA